jgi:hypothetical protein
VKHILDFSSVRVVVKVNEEMAFIRVICVDPKVKEFLVKVPDIIQAEPKDGLIVF